MHVAGVQVAMVLSVVFGCSKRSGRDRDVSFHRIPKIISNKGPEQYSLSQRRREGFIEAIHSEKRPNLFQALQIWEVCRLI